MALDDLATGLDLFQYLMKDVGQSTSTSDDYATRAKAALNLNYWEILCLNKWRFALGHPPKVVTTVASQNVTVSSIVGTTVTLSAVIATSQAGRKFYVTANQAMYRISAHTAGTAVLTLDATYVETQASGAGVIYQDEYALDSSAMKVWGPLYLRGQYEGEVALINENEFKAKYGWARVAAVGLTEVATIIRDYDPGGGAAKSIQIQIAPWTELQVNMEYEFTKFQTLTYDGVAGTDTPVLPLQDRWVIAERAKWHLWRGKNDNLADSAWIRADQKIAQMVDTYLKPTSKQRLWFRPRFGLGV
jgi:hypothetical protein